MEGMLGGGSELLLTDYLLNFGEESARECPYEDADGGFSSGVESGDEVEDDDEPLSLLKKSSDEREKPRKDCRVARKVSSGAKKDKENRGNGSSDISSKKEKSEKDKVDKIREERLKERKAKDRLRSAKNRAQRTQKFKELEKECEELKANNKVLSEKNALLNEKLSSLEDQVEYLESVIANESALSSILNTLAGPSGLESQKVPVRLNSMKRKRTNTATEGKEAKRKNGGVCLHIAKGRMSLEFCHVCHNNSVMCDE